MPIFIISLEIFSSLGFLESRQIWLSRFFKNSNDNIQWSLSVNRPRKGRTKPDICWQEWWCFITALLSCINNGLMGDDRCRSRIFGVSWLRGSGGEKIWGSIVFVHVEGMCNFRMFCTCANSEIYIMHNYIASNITHIHTKLVVLAL